MLSEIPNVGDLASGAFPDFGSGDVIDPSTQSPIEITMIMLPILATLVGTIRTNLRPREKWATCLMASNQIVDQIYKFRLRTDKYDTQAPLPVKEGEEPVEISPKMRATVARKDFIETCTQIYSHAISTEVSKGGALKMGEMAKLQTQHEADRKIFIERLKRHVKGNLYGQKLPKAPDELKKKPMTKQQAAKELEGKKNQAKKTLNKAKNLKKSKQGGMLMKLMSMTPAGKKMAKQAEKMMAQADGAMGAMDKLNGAMDMVSKVGGQVMDVADKVATAGGDGEPDAEQDDLGAKKGGGVDDLVSQMPIEAYIDARVRPYVEYLERRAPIMSCRGLVLEHIAMIMNAAGAVLALFNGEYIAITVAVASVSMAFLDYFYIPSQLAATNKALEDCHNLLLYWDSLSLVQRKTRAVKLKVCLCVEGAVLALCQARTGVSSALPSEQEESGDE